MSTPVPPAGDVPSYVHEETVYEDGQAPPVDDGFDDDGSGDRERTLTDRIQQLVEQPGRAEQQTPTNEPESLSSIAAGNLDNSTAGVDWSFVQSRDPSPVPSARDGSGDKNNDSNADTKAGNDDDTPVGQRIVVDSLDTRPDTNARKRLLPGALDTQPERGNDDTRPAGLDPADTRPIPGTEGAAPPAKRRPLGDGGSTKDRKEGFGIMRRPKR